MKRLLLFIIPLVLTACMEQPATKPMAPPEKVSVSSLPERATLKTSMGDIIVELYRKDAPRTVWNFTTLARLDSYDGTLFHRVIPDFMIQGGDPNSKLANKQLHGRGGPGYTFEDEINEHKLVRGSLAMANSGANTNGSQFFIITGEETPWLDGRHTNFGKVVEGQDIADAIQKVKRDANDHPEEDVILLDILFP